MKKTRLIVILFLFLIPFQLFSAVKEQKNEPAAIFKLSGADNVLMAQKLSTAQGRVNSMVQRNIECSDLMSQLKEAEKIYESLKTSPDIKDPVVLKDLLLTRLSILDTEAQRRIATNSRMDLIYQTMIITGLVLIVLMIIYSIYMYSKRK